MGLAEAQAAQELFEQEIADLEVSYDKLVLITRAQEHAEEARKTAKDGLKDFKPKNISELSSYTVVDAFGNTYEVDPENGKLTQL